MLKFYLKFSILHNINYSAEEMAQIFDNQYFTGDYRKRNFPLENNTVLVGHEITKPEVYKTLLFRMRNIAKTNYTLKEVIEKRKPRIGFCGYSVTSTDFVRLIKSNESFHFNGLANCGSYWRCPVCALKIANAKQDLLFDLITKHEQTNNKIGFLTLTVRHNKNDTLKKSLTKLLSNYRKFQQIRFFAKNKIENNFIGQVKTLEITYSLTNGWHPHLHLLYFYNSNDEIKIEIFQKKIIKDWANYKDNDGLISANHQKIIVDKNDISNYLAKLDITAEMTKSNLKSSKGLTPMTALGKLAVADYDDFKQKRLLYGIYTHYVEETQGKHFVNISNTLIKLYELNEKTDDQIVNETIIDEILLKITKPVWQKICKNDLQPLLINKFKFHNLEGLTSILAIYKDFNNTFIDFSNDIPILKNLENE